MKFPVKKDIFRKVQNNYEIYSFFVRNLINENFRDKSEIYILDFGCGSGKMLSHLSDICQMPEFEYRKIYFYGVDIFVDKEDLNNARIKAKNAIIKSIKPYENFDFKIKFDIVISNQVFEHINNLEIIYSHLNFLMNKKSFIIAGFPTKEIIIEPHLKIPFIHLLKKNTKNLYFILLFFSILKVGQFRKRFKYKNEKNAYLNNRYIYCNNNLFYRDFKEHIKLFKIYFSDFYDISDKYLTFLKPKRKLINFLKVIIYLIPSETIKRKLIRNIFGVYLIIEK